MQYLMCLMLFILMLAAINEVRAAEYVVDTQHPKASDENPGTAESPLKTIGKAARMVRAGDTIIVKSGVYREAVRLEHSGTPGAPVTFVADPPGSVVITGADVVTGWKRMPGEEPVYQVSWEHQFIINHLRDGTPVEHHPEDAPVWGRAEQVMVDGHHLAPAGDLSKLVQEWRENQERRLSEDLPLVPDPDDPTTWYGMFAVDTSQKKLCIWLADGSDPDEHSVEASSRGLIFGVNPWMSREGVEYVHVRGFIFRYGATFPQRAAVWLHGRHNLMEQCVVEDMSGSGANVGGTMRRCVVRRCGHTGGGARGDGFLNEECLWEGNSWKPINRGWDVGGFKMARVDGGVFRRCAFRRNGGPGLWMDIHVRNVLVTECVFQENELSGLFIEISRDITVLRNLAVGNGVNAKGHSWSCGGIQIAESQNCIVAFNTCIGNKDGITFREQGPRVLDTEDYGKLPYYNMGNVILGNVCAFNQGYQLGIWYDNGFFGWHPADKEKFGTEEAYEEYLKTIPDKVYDPTRVFMVIDRNLYFSDAEQKMFLYGVTWRPKHLEFDEIASFADHTGFDARSQIADPVFVNVREGDYRFQPDSPAWKMQVGWLMAPSDIGRWIDELLPSFKDYIGTQDN